MTGPDVIVVGAGVMGCSIALHLAEQRLTPLVLERAVPGAEASTAAAGMLAAAIEAGQPGPGLSLGLTSRRMHAQLAGTLREEHGIDDGFRRCGVMRLAFDDDEARQLARRADALRAIGVQAELLDGREARRRERELDAGVVAALDLPDEAQLEPVPLLRGLAIAAQRAGAIFHTGAHVRRVVLSGGRVRGVAFDDATVDAAHVVVAAGSWTNAIGGVQLPAGTLEPVRGQILATVTRPPILRRIAFGAGGYVVVRPDGRVLCGSTEERVGLRRGATLAGVESIAAIARRIAPALAQAPLEGYWANFRPATPDGLPLVGPTDTEGLWLATGHYRNGILLAPVTAKIIADAIVGRDPMPEAAAVDPRRFGRAAGKERP